MKTMTKAELIANIELLAERTEKAESLIAELKNDLHCFKRILENELEKEQYKAKEVAQSKQIRKPRGIF